MKRASLTQYDEFPEEMLIYMRNYGPHFNKKLFKFAVSNMTKREGGVERPITPMTREEVEALLGRNEVTVERGQLYDCTYVANMCKADFLGSSVADEKHMALYIKDVIDDVDAPDGLVFNRFYADCCYKGIAIEWDAML
jgi:hypothetical protein